jgi:hypothetical protein
LHIDIAGGSVSRFDGHPTGDHSCCGDIMALNDDSTTLYVGYGASACVVAYDVSTHQQIWTSQMAGVVQSVSYSDALVLVSVRGSYFTVLRAEDGMVHRQFDVKAGCAFDAHAIINEIGAFFVFGSSLFLCFPKNSRYSIICGCFFLVI